MPAGDITLGTPKTVPAITRRRIIIEPGSLEVQFEFNGELVSAVARNGTSRGFSWDGTTLTRDVPASTATGFTDALARLRSGANANAGVTAVISGMRTDGIITLAGSVA